MTNTTQPVIEYYESHVTIEPVFEDRLRLFEDLCKPFGFKVANLLLQKNRADTPERSNKDSFCTGHCRDYGDAVKKVLDLVSSLQSAGFEVWRYKIEGIVVDVKLDRKKATANG